MTKDLYNLNLPVKLMVFHHQILFNLAIAEAILMQISAEQVPSLHSVAHRYLKKLVTSSNFGLHILIFALLSFMLSGHNLDLFCADFLFICPSSVLSLLVRF